MVHPAQPAQRRRDLPRQVVVLQRQRRQAHQPAERLWYRA
uniref:Uncharacterized protein n=1 Tax=Arundo donax TaxID=35708 RepID=A0A0A8XT73_ARUDO